MRKIVFFILIFVTPFFLYSQEIIKVWSEGNPPTENGLSDKAELVVYLPQNVGQERVPAVLICPGGGYAGLSMPYEGHGFAKWLTDQGFAGIILKYRLPNKNKEVPFEDAEKAISIIKQNSDKWNIDTNKLGFAGFSAGGHLAAILSNRISVQNSIHPYFTILFYPVISLEKVTRGGTRTNLLGENPSATDIVAYSANLQVTDHTPPAIIFSAEDDGSVPPNNSTMYYDALKRHNIPASLYIFPEGGHGWALLDSFKYNGECMDLLKLWLEKFK